MKASGPLPLPELLLQYIALSEHGVMVLDASDRFVYINAAAAELLGFEVQVMLGLQHDELMHWLYTQKRGARIEWPLVGASLDQTWDRQRKTAFRDFELDLGDGRWLLVTEQLCPGGERVMHCSDITRQKVAEQALQLVQTDMGRLALIDGLTGLPNRHDFLQQLRQEFAKSVRHGRPLCLAMLDLDYFKRVNDRFGHAVGDEVLQHFALFLREQLRVGDVVGRLGGEEFGVLLPETELEDALRVLTRTAQDLAMAAQDGIAPGMHYTFSGGLVPRLDHAGFDCSSLLVLADQALHEAKAAGRAQIMPYRWH